MRPLDSCGDSPVATLAREEDGTTIAYRQRRGGSPGLLFLGGFRSDMTGTKATALDRFAAEKGLAFVRFDYRGHGASGGHFADYGIGDWRDDALLVLDRVSEGPQLVVGSSMGAWIAVLLLLDRPERIAGLVTVAAAADFTEDLLWNRWGEAERRQLVETGEVRRASAYSPDPDTYSRRLIEDGRRHLVLRRMIPFSGPARLLHGFADADVPWRTSLTLLERLSCADATLTLIKGGDHRLSSPEHIAMLLSAVAELAGRGR